MEDEHQKEIAKLQNRHKDEIKRLKKDHEMELTYQTRNGMNKSENEASHRYTEQLENDLKSAKEEILRMKIIYNENKTQQNPLQWEANVPSQSDVLHTSICSLS